ncbi:MAG: RNA pseudouridine synthase, partial [bacterium]
YTLVECRLLTGRTHQIRVHARFVGHPVAGDPVYGRRGELGLARQFLHAWRLQFTHPRTGQTMDFTSPLPADLQEVLEALRRKRATGSG